jgi:hypothetical protein
MNELSFIVIRKIVCVNKESMGIVCKGGEPGGIGLASEKEAKSLKGRPVMVELSDLYGLMVERRELLNLELSSSQADIKKASV